MNKEEFINEFNDWTKEEILGRAFEICCKNIELKEIEKEHQKINGDLRIEIKELKDRIDKAFEIIDLIKPELWNISNKMTYRLLDVKTTLKGDKE